MEHFPISRATTFNSPNHRPKPHVKGSLKICELQDLPANPGLQEAIELNRFVGIFADHSHKANPTVQP